MGDSPLVGLVTEAPAVGMFVKYLVDAIRGQAPSITGMKTLILAAVLALLVTAGLGMLQYDPAWTVNDFGWLFMRGVAGFGYALLATQGQEAANRNRMEKKIEQFDDEHSDRRVG